MARTVVFVCQHGAAKSVIAAAWLRRLAAEGGLEIRAVARGTHPSDELSATAVAGLLRDGLAPDDASPRQLTSHDVEVADKLVGFARDVTADAIPGRAVELWSVPAVSAGYEAAP